MVDNTQRDIQINNKPYQYVDARPLPVDVPADFSHIDLTDWASIKAKALPKGFRYFIERDTQQIVEPVLLYLWDNFVNSSTWALNTEISYANDLYEWFTFIKLLSNEHDEQARLTGNVPDQIAWDTVTNDHVMMYCNILKHHDTRSPVTGLNYSSQTISRRINTIELFYKWIADNKFFERTHVKPEVGSLEYTNNYVSNEKLFLAHTQSSGLRVKRRRSIPKRSSQPKLDVFKSEEFAKLLNELGPDPTVAVQGQSIRNRLIVLLAASTGMRVHECVALNIDQIMSIKPNHHIEVYKLNITVTKGGMPRDVSLVASLHNDLIKYINGERAAILKDAQEPTKRLFINHGNNNRGAAITSHQVMRAFHEAVKRAGLTKEISVDYGDGDEYKKVAKYSFHKLRHTFAVGFVISAKKENRDPILQLKALLGHKNASTTYDTYLRGYETNESEISDLVMGYVKSLLGPTLNCRNI